MEIGGKENPVLKALAYITRQAQDGVQLLVFTHRDFPEAGIQVPAGTMEAGECPEDAVLREAFEESGLEKLGIVRQLGVFDYYAPSSNQYHRRHVYLLESQELLPDQWSHAVTSGAGDTGLVFDYFWIDVNRGQELSGGQGSYLGSFGRGVAQGI